MQLRQAVESELETVGAITVAAYEPFLFGDHGYYRAHLLDSSGRHRDAELWVATPDDSEEILGSVTVCPIGSPWRELAGDDQGEFRMLAVSPTARRQGVGRALAQLALDRARAQGARSVLICSLAEMVEAHRLYQGLGFVRVPELDWRPEGFTLLVFRRDL